MLSVENPNPGMRNSLSCLAHPTVVLSIFLLLLNDHLLKALFPGVITGKLSDFAGLLFFPFVISLGISFFFDRQGYHQQFIGALSIGFAALVFSAVKLLPWANTAVEHLATAVTGVPSQIVLDPTDLIALPILGYSWMIWNKKGKSVSTRRALLMFGIALLATMATSISPDPLITQLVVQDNLIFAGSADWAYVSDDNGFSWTELSDVPIEVAERLSMAHQLPKIVCDSHIETECYRISGEEVVEYSTDGGSSWSVAWRVPPGRRWFMDQLVSGPLGGYDIDLGPYDIAIVGSSEHRSIIVAMGNEGVLIGSEDGTWFRQEVGPASPTPFSAEFDTGILWILRLEIIAITVTAILAWVILNNSYWARISDVGSRVLPNDQTTKWIIKPLWTSLIVYLILFVVAVVVSLNIYQPAIFSVAVYLLVGIQILPIAGYCIYVKRLKKHVPNPAEQTWVVLQLFSMLAGILVLGSIPLVLWTLGYIPFYSIAFILSVVIIVWLIGFACKEVEKRASATINHSSDQESRLKSG